jgi:hypothetical protein
VIASLLRRLRLKRELDRSLRERKAARLVRSEAAHRGVSSYWQRSGARNRELFR